MLRRLVGEAVGTALLVLVIGAAALAAAGLSGTWSYAIIVGLAAGLALAILYHFISPVSGGHFNPAVTLGLAAAGLFPFQEVVPYIVAQVFGALVGLGILHLANGALLNIDRVILPTGPYDAPVSFAAEAIATGLLVASYLAATHKRARPGMAPVMIGLCLAVLQAALISVSAGVLNPARAVAMAVYLPEWAGNGIWWFVAAGIFGGIVAGIVWGRLLEENFLQKAE